MSSLRLTTTVAPIQIQTLTPQMRQSLEILQAPALELRTRLQQELTKNPVLEEVVQPADPTILDDAVLDAKIEQLRHMDEDERAFASQSRGLTQWGKKEEERRQFFFDSLTQNKTLAEHLIEQLRLSTNKENVIHAGEIIIGNLDIDGFLRVSLEEMTSGEQIKLEELEEALQLIHTLHPVGVGARDLRECLLIQLDRLGHSEEIETVIVSQYLDHLAHHRYEQIARSLEVEVERVQQAAAFIATLDPKPGRAFLPEERQNIVQPEIFIEKSNDQWVVTMNDDLLPRVRISDQYKDLLATSGGQNELRDYLRTHMQEGRQLIQAIHNRQDTLRKIGEAIVRYQTDFFEQGISALKPLTLAMIAEQVGVHETTISRAIAGKYVQTPLGIFEMKFFFTPGYRTAEGENISNKSVKDALQEIIEREDKKHPYSDEDIVRLFVNRGIKLARRTIAKYRDELRILPSSLRRIR